MRLFGSERKVMDRMGLQGEVIQHSMMTKSIERSKESRRKQLWST
jgi:preprotein translocase subunit SecA